MKKMERLHFSTLLIHWCVSGSFTTEGMVASSEKSEDYYFFLRKLVIFVITEVICQDGFIQEAYML